MLPPGRHLRCSEVPPHHDLDLRRFQRLVLALEVAGLRSRQARAGVHAPRVGLDGNGRDLPLHGRGRRRGLRRVLHHFPDDEDLADEPDAGQRDPQQPDPPALPGLVDLRPASARWRFRQRRGGAARARHVDTRSPQALPLAGPAADQDHRHRDRDRPGRVLDRRGQAHRRARRPLRKLTAAARSQRRDRGRQRQRHCADREHRHQRGLRSVSDTAAHHQCLPDRSESTERHEQQLHRLRLRHRSRSGNADQLVRRRIRLSGGGRDRPYLWRHYP